MVPLTVTNLVASGLFILFALLTLYENGADYKNNEKKLIISPFFTVVTTFFIAEMGDKTQFATITYTTETVLVLTGTVLGVVCAAVLAVIVGIIMGKAINAKIIKWIAAMVFFIYGISGI
ncbi:MAG: TMEM165/GDT1 family protein [Endomicrobium sp.]|jgi:putative Ca2+/H+ antiporter (TMEM165/GDT1 family)|nr:TMEM165/GDT1 family protein [Endomicrobium sp.]